MENVKVSYFEFEHVSTVSKRDIRYRLIEKDRVRLPEEMMMHLKYYNGIWECDISLFGHRYDFICVETIDELNKKLIYSLTLMSQRMNKITKTLDTAVFPWIYDVENYSMD